MSRAQLRRLAVTIVVLSSVLMIFAGPIRAQANMVTGTLIFKEKIALSPTAVAVITLGDRSPNGAGIIIGQQRIDGVTGSQIPFAVQFDPAVINQKHAYSVFASLIDAGKEWQSPDPVPTITGGPLDGLAVELVSPSYTTPAQVTGTIAMFEKVALTPTAVAYAVIMNETTGRIAARQVIPSPAAVPIPFTVSYDAALINPDDTYGAIAAIIDGSTLYQSGTPVAITPGATLDLTVAKTNVVIPGGATPAPSPVVTPSPVGTATTAPSAPGGTTEPSAKPTKSPKPTTEPTLEPTATPEVTPTPEVTATPAPTPVPTVTAEPTPTVEPSATVAATAAPLTVSGTVAYREPSTLSSDAVLTISVVQVVGNEPTVSIVGKQEMSNPGQVPIAFSVTLDQSVLDPTLDTQLWATLVDGPNAWSTGGGIPVATNGAPSEGVLVLLTFRPDLIEGEVTGVITGVPSDTSSAAWFMAWVVDTSDRTILSLTSGPVHGSTLVPFLIPFKVEDVGLTASYNALAAVFDDVRTWRSSAGVPVITNGNPYTGIQLPVVAAGPSPTPTQAATAVPTPTAVPVATATPATPPPASGGGVDPAVLLGVLVLVVIGGIVVFVFMRR